MNTMDWPKNKKPLVGGSEGVMGEKYKLKANAPVDQISPEDFRTFLRILDAVGYDTADPGVREFYGERIETLATFGSCTVVVALFIAERNQKGENWRPLLVRDSEFPEDHPLALHWVATNGKINVDLTVADQEKDLIAVGSDLEKILVNGHKAEGSSAPKKFQAGLDKYRDEKGKPLGLTVEELHDRTYAPLLLQAARPSHTVRVIPIAQFKK